MKMPVYSKKLQLNVERLRYRLLFEEGIKHFRFLKKGKSLIVAMKLTEFKSHVKFDEPVLYIPPMPIHDAPFVLQADRILVEAKNPKIAGQLINSFLSKHLPEIVLSRDLKELMKSYEDKHLEFKETLRYDIQRKTIGKNVEKACLKTICAFLNAEGGLLVIGISDDKRILGLSKDFQTLRHRDRDGFENHLMNQVSDKIGDGFFNFIKLDFHEIENKVICIVKVFPSDKPAYFEGERGQEFYVRVSNSSRPFSMSEATDYIKEHWK